MFGDLTISPKSSAPAPSAMSLPQFSTFLLPSFGIPFRKKQSSSSSISSSSSSSSSSTQGSRTPSIDSASTLFAPSLSSSPTLYSACASPTSPTSKSFFPDGATALDFSPAVESPSHLSRPFALPLNGRHLGRAQPDTIRCSTCATDIAFGAQIVSKGFTGRHGRAYLVAAPSTKPSPSCPASPVAMPSIGATEGVDLVNIRVGRPENRQLVTGAHVVADISCLVCGTKLGWKYVDAKEQAQKYKVGKFILETARVSTYRSWEDVELDGHSAAAAYSRPEKHSAQPKSSDEYSRTSGTSSFDLRGSDGRPTHGLNDADNIEFDSDDEDECEDIFAGVWDPEVVAKRRSGKIANLRRRM